MSIAVAEPPVSKPLPRRLVALLALTAGGAVANLYYIQPLLGQIATEFHVSDGTAGLLVTFSQVGFAIGLALLVPLGDVLERRRLIATVLVAAALAAAASAAAPSITLLAATLLVLGLLSVVAQIVVPLSASLAAPHERGAVLGTVMSGLLIGILGARTLSGLVAEIGGWRLTFVLAAVAMLLLSLLLRRALPLAPPTEPVRYPAALRSVLTLVREEPVLRQRMVLGACGMAAFSVLWTSIAFLLTGAPYHYSEGIIGLFGLAGVGGAAIAPVAGRLADRGHDRLGMTMFLVILLASWGLLALGRSSLVALLAGIVLLDLGAQGAHISNQSAIYRLRPEARSRLTTAYMVSFFIGGVAGSLLSASVYDSSGWSGVSLAGAAITLAGLAFWGLTARVGARRPRPDAAAASVKAR